MENAAIIDALAKDLGRPRLEVSLLDIGMCISEIDHAISNLSEWSKPEQVPSPLPMMPGQSEIRNDPLGAVLILTPFNYPVNLALSPLCAALAGGNVALLKTSELCPNVSRLLCEVFPKYIDEKSIAVVEGGVDVSTYLLSLKFDHIFFTGSEKVGRIVAKAAAEHLTPVTLELGGKCPAIITETADLELAARRVMWTKWANAGQTCLAVDYAIVHVSVVDTFLLKCAEALKKFAENESVEKSRNFSRIVSTAHTKRISNLIELCKDSVKIGGQFDVSKKFIEPTVIGDIDRNSALMKEEIFGPLMGVMQYSDLKEVYAIIQDHPTPLALYVFTGKPDVAEIIYRNTQSGGFCINDCMMHFGNTHLPFGGVGTSGMGSYHGIHGFKTFTHQRAVLKASSLVDPWIRYPPYTESNENLFQRAISLGWVDSAKLYRLLTILGFISAVAAPFAYARL